MGSYLFLVRNLFTHAIVVRKSPWAARQEDGETGTFNDILRIDSCRWWTSRKKYGIL